MIFGEKNLVGVDIGSYAIKVAHLKKVGKKYKLVNFGIENLPPQTIVDNEIISTASVANTLQTLFKKLNIRQKEIALSISGHSVIIKRITEPMMKDEELEEQIRWEAEQQIPFDIAEVEIDYQVLQKKFDQGQIEVLLVAAKKDEINNYLQIAYESNLKPTIIDVDAFALQNSFEYNYSDLYPSLSLQNKVQTPISYSTVALVNIGASFTTVNIVQGGITLYNRDIANGGNSITEEIRKQLKDITEEAAESYKIGGKETLGSEILPQEVEDIIQSVVDVLVGEIQRSLDFYQATAGTQEISKIIITGGTSRISYLKKLLEERTKIQVEPLNPFRLIEVDPNKFDINIINQMAPQATIAVGLALRKLKENKND